MARQHQTYTGALTIIEVIGATVVTVEDMGFVGITDALPGIGDTQMGLAVLLRHRDTDGAAVWGILEGIRQEVVDDLLHLQRVKGQQAPKRVMTIFKRDMMELGLEVIEPTDLRYELRKVARLSMELGARRLQAAEVEELVNEVEETVSITVDELQRLPQFPFYPRLLEELIEGRENHRQRCAELMTDIGEEVELHLVELLFLPGLHTQLLGTEFILLTVIGHSVEDIADGDDEKDIDEDRPRGGIERRRNTNREHLVLRALHLAVNFLRQDEMIGSRGQVRQGHGMAVHSA